MTTLQQNQPPIFVYEIWEYDGVIRGRLIDEKPFWKAQRDYPRVYDLQGQKAHFMVCTNDMSLSKAEAIAFAKEVYEGKVRRHVVDLTPCNPKPKK